MEVRQLYKELSPVSSTPPQSSKLYQKATKVRFVLPLPVNS